MCPLLRKRTLVHSHTVQPQMKDTMKEDKPPNKGQAESTLVVYTRYRKSPLKEDNRSTKDKTASPEGVLFIKRFHCGTYVWEKECLAQFLTTNSLPYLYF